MTRDKPGQTTRTKWLFLLPSSEGRHFAAQPPNPDKLGQRNPDETRQGPGGSAPIDNLHLEMYSMLGGKPGGGGSAGGERDGETGSLRCDRGGTAKSGRGGIDRELGAAAAALSRSGRAHPGG